MNLPLTIQLHRFHTNAPFQSKKRDIGVGCVPIEDTTWVILLLVDPCHHHLAAFRSLCRLEKHLKSKEESLFSHVGLSHELQ